MDRDDIRPRQALHWRLTFRYLRMLLQIRTPTQCQRVKILRKVQTNKRLKQKIVRMRALNDEFLPRQTKLFQ